MGQAPDAIGRFDENDTTDPGGVSYGTFIDAEHAAAGSDMDALAGDIEETRSEMTETIDAISERLNPDHLKEQAKEMVRDATVGKAQDMVSNAGESARNAGNGFLDTVRQNPLPAAVAGIGLGWLWKNRSKGQNSSYNYNYSGGSGYNYGGGYDYRDRVQGDQAYYYQPQSMTRNSRTSNVAGAVTDTASSVAGTVGSTASNVAGTVTSGAGQALDQVTNVTHQAVEGVGHLGSQAQSQFRDTYDQMLQESPLTLGVVAIGVGLAVGMLLPETQMENQVMGEKKEDLMDKAQTMAQETMEKVQNVASQATDAVQQSAQDQGLTAP